MTGAGSDRAPQISAAGDMTFPDETLVLCGDGLEGATLRIWAEGLLTDLAPVKTAHDRMLAVIPESWPTSTMLVWPVKGESVGRPVRVNAATAWWVWPLRASAGEAGETVQIIGKNLTLPGNTPIVFLAGPGVARELRVSTAEPYSVRAVLPALKPGAYALYAHNGTGGRFGWSEGRKFEVRRWPDLADAGTVNVNDMGAKPDDGSDDASAIERAVAAVSGAGGGRVRFGEGAYHVSRPIVLGDGVSLVGVGMGEHDPGGHGLEGAFTALGCMPGLAPPPAIVEFRGRRSSAASLTLRNGNNGGGQVCVGVYAHDVTVKQCRVIMTDTRRWEGGTAADRRPIHTAALHIDAPGAAQIRVEDCEIHSCVSCIRIGQNIRDIPSHNSDRNCPPSTDYVSVTGTVMRGSYRGSPKGTKGVFGENAGVAGIGIYNGKNIIAERNDFGGADRYAGLTLNRTVAVVNTAVRHCYFAHNRSLRTGNHDSMYEYGEFTVDPRAKPQTANQGEQYIFHYHYPQGGLFDVTAARRSEVTVTTLNISPDPRPKPEYRISWSSQGSRIIDEVGKNSHWVLFICAGKGAGQYREVNGMHDTGAEVWFGLSRPWRVVPDRTSRVVLMAAYRNNIVYSNFLDPGEDNGIQKIHGVCFWYACFDNIVADNTFRNTTSGVVLNSSYRNPTGWNMTRGNVIENTYGRAYDTSERAAAYVDHFRPYGSRWPEKRDRVWLEVGNIARANRCRKMEVAAFLHTRAVYNTLSKGPDASHPEGGLMMCVIENNEFLDATHAIHLGCPANWPVVRNNRVSTGGRWPDGVAFELRRYINEPLVVANGKQAALPADPGQAPARLLENGGFESLDSYGEQPEFWRSFSAPGSEADLLPDDREPFEGKRCVTIVKRTAKHYSGFSYRPRLHLREGGTYRISGAARGTPGAKGLLVFMMYAEGGQYLGHHTAMADLAADWSRFSEEFQVLEGAVSVAFEIRAQGREYTVSYDSLTLTELE